MAADFGHAFPTGADGGARNRYRTEFCGRPNRGHRRRNIGEPAYGVRRARFRRVALDHARHELALLLTRRDVPRRTADWLADIGTLPARRARYPDRLACTCFAEARAACNFMRITQSSQTSFRSRSNDNGSDPA